MQDPYISAPQNLTLSKKVCEFVGLDAKYAAAIVVLRNAEDTEYCIVFNESALDFKYDGESQSLANTLVNELQKFNIHAKSVNSETHENPNTSDGYNCSYGVDLSKKDYDFFAQMCDAQNTKSTENAAPPSNKMLGDRIKKLTMSTKVMVFDARNGDKRVSFSTDSEKAKIESFQNNFREHKCTTEGSYSVFYVSAKLLDQRLPKMGITNPHDFNGSQRRGQQEKPVQQTPAPQQEDSTCSLQ